MGEDLHIKEPYTLKKFDMTLPYLSSVIIMDTHNI